MEAINLYLWIYIAGFVASLLILYFVNTADGGVSVQVPYHFSFASWAFVAIVVVIIIRVLDR